MSIIHFASILFVSLPIAKINRKFFVSLIDTDTNDIASTLLSLYNSSISLNYSSETNMMVLFPLHLLLDFHLIGISSVSLPTRDNSIYNHMLFLIFLDSIYKYCFCDNYYYYIRFHLYFPIFL